jgi:prepilin signal peptidase PulO-like enzyme (type II secretory pathway)
MFALILFVFIFVFGLIVGSFLNVVIFRLETGEGIVKKRSHCPHCAHVLRWYDLIPVLSFVLLGGKCRDCAKPISWQYPLVEISAGALFVWVVSIFWYLGFDPSFAAGVNILDVFGGWSFIVGNLIIIGFWLFAVSCLIVIFVYDLRHYIIPDSVIYPVIVVSILFRVFEVLDAGHWNLYEILNSGFLAWGQFLIYLACAVGATIFFLIIVLLTRGRGMGLGDVKLAFLMGLVLGWPQILLALLLAFGSGAVVGVGLVIADRKTLKSQIPFGPFLAAGTIFALLAGSFLINWYFNFLGL